ncbi:Nif3-like dinuclear metal center hexameric protein [Timonella senegalensis]|uniref:Nif3-like dinuclear metal center hexameric protein n=1 Tax=Timonella senegalensis TaxID=1465825 RepID=UPI0028AB06E3|nr:Nif3-like dinuclear metal center hexameric protein [Timonella senegalensis]
MSSQTTPSSHHATLADVLEVLERLYPAELAESWDKPGLSVGNLAAPVSKVYFALDATRAVVEDAIAWSADLIVTHHPFLFTALGAVTTQSDRGASIYRLISSGCALFSAHTNADSARRGVNDALADRLGLVDTRPLTPTINDDSLGLGRIGRLPAPLRLEEFATLVANALPQAAQGIRVVGPQDATVSTVAVLGGSGGSLLEEAAASGADVYLTSDLKHHDVLDFVEARANSATTAPGADAGPTRTIVEKPFLIDSAHWASESVWLPYAAADLADALAAAGTPIETRISDITTDPWTFHVRAN